MKTKDRFNYLILLIILLVAVTSPAVHAAIDFEGENNYCILPPFVEVASTPNLLMMFDNSSSMYDLLYVDKGYGACSVSGAACGTGIQNNCPVGQTCVLTRQPDYCYDNTYMSTTKYSGYFIPNVYYQYSLALELFVQVGALPASGCTYEISNTLCVTVAGGKVTGFAAKGNYLNWLAASKYDVQKQILSGGKWVDKVCSTSTNEPCSTNADCPAPQTCTDVLNFHLSESRGCVGRKYIKEPNTGDYVEGLTPTGLGITFGVHGPPDQYDATALSRGGQTYIAVFQGNYDQASCGTAIENILTDAQKQVTTDSISLCLNYVKGKTCSLDSSRACTTNADCPNTAGICGVFADGVCGAAGGGTCGPQGGGVCTDNSGLCTAAVRKCVGGNNPGTVCTKDATCKGGGTCGNTCAGGGRAGSSCAANADCVLKTCTAGKPNGTPCNVPADCNVGHCTAGKPAATLCSGDADCNVRTCSAGKPATTFCAVDGDCNSGLGTCTAGKPLLTPCAQNTDCDVLTGTCESPTTTQIASTFGQSMHSCYQYRVKGQEPASNEVQQISNPSGCNSIYKNEKKCIGGANDDKRCSTLADCPGGAVCRGGPDTILPGSPVLVCNQKYGGYCASNPAGDNWLTTSWVAREYASADDCVMAKYKEYCGDLDMPPVVDPTDDASNTLEFSNVPAILGDIGLTAQLGNPIGTIVVRPYRPIEPTGLIQEFSDRIRFGALSFHYNGSTSECNKYCSNDHARPCTTNAECLNQGVCNWPVPCPKKCSLHPDISCTTYLQCPARNQVTEQCIATAIGSENRDGGKIIHYIGDPGTCSNAPAVSCTKNSDCGAGACISVGNHNYGLINTVDRLRATSWTPFAEAFYNAIGYYGRTNAYTDSPGRSNIALRLNGDNDFVETKNPSQYVCQKNNILLITDGASTTDLNPAVNTFATNYVGADPLPGAGPAGACPQYAGSMNVDNLSWIAKNRNIKQLVPAPAIPAPATALKSSEFIDTYVVFTGADNGVAGDCNSLTMMNNVALYGGTEEVKIAENSDQLTAKIRESFEAVAGRATSGTAASVIASGQGSGANLLQAIFYPKKQFPGYCSLWESRPCIDTSECSAVSAGICIKDLTWVGTLHNLWYYIDPRLGNSHILIESSPAPPASLPLPTDLVTEQLSFGDDCMIGFSFNATTSKTEIAPLSGTSCPASNISLEQTQYFLWEAALRLFGPSPVEPVVPGVPTIPRNTVLTSTDGVNLSVVGNWMAAGAAMQKRLGVTNLADASAILDYTLGTSDGGFRNRRVNLVLPPGTPRPARWRFGDIINSTPKVVSWVKLNNYDKSYSDFTYREFINSTKYTDRGKNTDTYGHVFVGANDGMLHAFRLGTLNIVSDNTNVKATLSGKNLGNEDWAFMPKSTLPYLKYLMNPSYSHLYYVDSTPYVFDASICDLGSCAGDYWNLPKDVNSWRTVLIGGSRYGGAAKDACTNDINGDAVVNKYDCVITPGRCSVSTATFCTADDECPAGETCDNITEGRSSYFALDVTDSGAMPKLLWEFSHPEMGFTTTGPAIMKINGRTPSLADPATSDADQTKNGRWFVVFASGPTGPIDLATHQFKGFSDQEMKLFIFDLKQGPGLNNANVIVVPTGKQYAFAGSLNNGSMDFDLDYQDDVLYIGYAQAEQNPPVAATEWKNGGVLRLITREDLNSSMESNTALSPLNWQLSEFMPNTGAVTSSVGHIAHYSRFSSTPDKGWVYFGSGRYYFKALLGADDTATQRTLFGVEEPCLTSLLASYVLADSVCGGVPAIDLYDATDSSVNSLPAGKNGWFINLSGSSASQYNERVITDPLAAPNGAVFFTTFAPSTDSCSFGGTTYLWATKFDTGGSVASSLKGKAILQVSTGEIKEIDLKTAFKANPTDPPGTDHKLDRRSFAISGVPPMDKGLNVLVAPPPIETFMHIRKK